MPYFSIIITTHNNAATIERTLQSCLAQDFDDFEVIVVDDGSVDGTAERVRHLEDPRVHLIHHGAHRGVCPARNSGIRAARSSWTLILDCRHELRPGALRTMHSRTQNVPDEIWRAAFMYRLPSGGTSPRLAFIDDDWDYESYLCWRACAGASAEDYCGCIRTAAFQWLRYPDSAMPDAVFQLDFARQFRTRLFPEIVGMLHDQPNEHADFLLFRHCVADAPKMAAYLDNLLNRHGDTMQRVATPLFLSFLRSHALYHLLAGQRQIGIRSAQAYLKHCPVAPHIWGLMICGFLGPGCVSWFRQISEQPAVTPNGKGRRAPAKMCPSSALSRGA